MPSVTVDQVSIAAQLSSNQNRKDGQSNNCTVVRKQIWRSCRVCPISAFVYESWVSVYASTVYVAYSVILIKIGCHPDFIGCGCTLTKSSYVASITARRIWETNGKDTNGRGELI